MPAAAVPDDTDWEPRPSRGRRPDAAVVALGLVLACWALVFWRLGVLRHERFATFGFDLGIHDQAVWLLTHAHTPFITIRGIDVFGHHFTPIYWLFAPAYWLGAGPRFLLTLQVAGQVVGAVALYRLTLDLLGRGARWFGATVGAAFLLHPTSGWLVWEFFHPEVMALGPLMLAYRSARRDELRGFFIWSAIAAACKEDMFLAVGMIGLVVVAPRRLRTGLAVATGSFGAYLLYTRVIVSWRTGGQRPVFDDHYLPYAHSQLGVVQYFLTHPSTAWNVLTDAPHLAYYRALFIPVAVLLPLLGWRGFAVGLPVFIGNIVSGPGFPYTYVYRYHYSAIVVAAIFLGVVEAAATLQRIARRHAANERAVLAGLGVIVLVCGFFGYVHWGVGPGSTAFRDGSWPIRPDETVASIVLGTVNASNYGDVAALDAALHHIAPGAPTSAIYDVVAHLTHRERIYEWPNPWVPVNWGVTGEHQQDPARVQYILLRTGTAFGDPATASADQKEEHELFTTLLRHEFRVVFQQDDVVVARRVGAPECFTASAGLVARLGRFYRPVSAAPPVSTTTTSAPSSTGSSASGQPTVEPPSTAKVCPVT
jgi:uncharacterized membrane protein